MSETRDQDPPLPFTDPLAPLRAALRGRYEIERQIGQGAFATVYLARDLKHERKVAIKVLTADPSSETGEIRFIREIRLVARLQHPNILPLHDSGHVETQLYYVMPYVMGETLRIRMHRERQMPVVAACAIAREAADALAYAHSQGVVHRDIKPENILLSGGHAIVADFGIARVIDVAGVKQLTVPGIGGPGTPAYMSPEQLLGDRGVDARSDIYSLGCVLYEMLAGKPPFPGKDGFVKRFTEPPPHVSSLRRDVPPWLDRVLASALAKDPDDRYATATDLVAALSQPATPPRTPARDTPFRNALASPPLFESDPLEAQEFARAFPASYPNPGRLSSADPNALPAAKKSEGGFVARASRRLRAHPLRAGASIALVLIVALLVRGLASPAWSSTFGRSIAVDSARVIVLPFTGGRAGTLGQGVADDLYDALSQWEGLPLVADTRITQAIAKTGGPPSSESDALSLARQLGAGKLVWGHVTGTPGAARVRVHLYDVTTGDSKDEFAFVDSTADSREYPPVALRLLKIRGRPRAADGGDGLTRSYPAWSAYGRGHVALAKWDLAGAEREFRQAVRADAAYVPARVWLAQVTAWRSPERRDEWSAAATRASTDIAVLNTRDRLIAVGLSALAQRRHPEACRAYSQLTAQDPRDFVGWYGLGECQSLDSTVVPAASSPTRWTFRTSHRAAANAYIQALEIEPGAHAFFNVRKLRDMLPTASTRIRVGTSDPPNRQTFLAFPSIAERGDTLAFIPYSISSFAALPPQAMRSRNLALERNAEELLRFATNWTRRLPSDPAAHETLAEVFEISGDITGNPFRETAVMRALGRARTLSRNPHQLTRVATREVWLRFKREEFAEARRLTDSLLAANPQPSANDARVLIPIAALTGKLDRAVRLGKLSHPFLPRTAGSMPAQVREAAVELFVSAALGICGPRITSLEKQLDDQLVRYVPAERAADLRTDLLRRPLSLTAPCNGGESALRISNPRDRLTRMQQALASNKLPLVRALLDTLAEIESLGRPGDMSLDHTFQQAWVRSAIGDTAGALRVLDNTLGALPALSADNLGDVAAAAAVGRAIALRARLAAATGDWRKAERQGRALATLWETADPALRPLVDEVRSATQVSAPR